MSVKPGAEGDGGQRRRHRSGATMLSIGSLFSGIGGLELGLERAGLGTVAWQVERDPYCQRVLAKHWPTVERFDDVREVYGDSMGRLKKMTEEQVEQSVALYDAGCSLGELGKLFGVSRQSMWDLLRRRTAMRPQRRFGEDNHFYRGGPRADDAAQNRVEKAVANGALVRPGNCEECGCDDRPMADGRAGIQAHHDDYNYPLEVRWLCQPCHHAWHASNVATPRKEVPEEASAVDIICGGFPERPARISPAQARAQALLAAARDCGVSSLASSANAAPGGSSSKTSPRGHRDGSTQWCETWSSPAMKRYRYRCPRAMSKLRTCDDESSLLPTPSASRYGNNRGGAAGRTGKVRHSLDSLAKMGSLPGHPQGLLNPEWSAQAMGFPTGWTDCEP